MICVNCGIPALAVNMVPLATGWYCQTCAPSFQAQGLQSNTLPKKGTREVTAPVINAKEGFLFGSDPEMFVHDPEGRVVSAAGLIPGTKEEPFVVEFGAVQVDGMAAEYNITPVSTFADWNRNHQKVQDQLLALLPKGYTLEAVPSVKFEASVFDSSPDIAKALGCSPDFDAWTGELNAPPNLPDDPYLRCAGGHIHFGWTEDADFGDAQHIMNCRDLVKQLDWYLGGWSLKSDPDPTRRRLYGKAGACRYKTYGVEYRVLSNFWITTKEKRLAVWNRMQLAIHDMREANLAERAKKHNAQLVAAINTSTRDKGLESFYKFPLTTTDHSYARF